MTIKEYAIQLEDGYLDQDVCDNDVDMSVAFVYDAEATSKDSYDKFIELLAENVEVVRLNPAWDCLVCRFSDFYAKHKTQLVDLFTRNHWDYTEFDEDQIEYEMTLWTEALVAGYESESVYAKLVTALS